MYNVCVSFRPHFMRFDHMPLFSRNNILIIKRNKDGDSLLLPIRKAGMT